MKHYLLSIIMTLMLLTPSFSFGQKKSIKTETWIDACVKMRHDVRARLDKNKMPVESRWIRSNEKAEPFSVDVTGLDTLILVTDGGSDGPVYDHAIWANARLIAADGSFVWLDDLDYAYAKAGWDLVAKNKNAEGDPIVIAEKKYEHAMMCHANGTLVYALNNKYVRFEAEVGIDDKSPNPGGSVYFKATNIKPKPFVTKLLAEYPLEIGLLRSVVGNLENWMLDKDACTDKKILSKRISLLDNSVYFEKIINEISALENVDLRIRKYLETFEQVQKILDLQADLKWINTEAIQLAMKDMQQMQGFDKSQSESLYKELIALQKKGFDGIYRMEKEAIENAYKALQLKKEILLGNPLLKDAKIVASHYNLGSISRQAMAPQLGTQSNNWSNQGSARRSGFDAEIVELSNLIGEIKKHTIFKPENESPIADLKMHWDANKLMFTAVQEDKRWNVFQVNLDGSDCKTLIHTPEDDLDFFDGTYLPDGRIIANSNIGYQGVPCVNGDDPVGNMVLYNPSDGNMRRLTFDQDANWNPVVMNNGKVMYTRWEYTDLMHYYSRFVMYMNPDGTEQKALFGSGSAFPNSTFDIRPLPNYSSAFVGIISGHHGVARSGRLILFDPTKSRKGVEGMIQEIPYRNREIDGVVKDHLVDNVWPQFIKPTPINEKYYLVAAKLNPQDLWGIYLVDVFDNMTCIIKQEGEGFISPLLVAKRPTPPSIPDRVQLDKKEATVFIQDIYEGEGLRGVPRGTVKSLRLHSYEYAYVKTESNHNWQGIQSGWDIKRELGTVPVEEDGSVIFKVPANTPISIQPLDKDGAAIQWMRSWFTGQPGEVVSCIGCHEDQNDIVIPKRVIASQRPPHNIQAPEGGVRSFTFDLEIQPVLDRACIACHNGEKAFDLRGGEKDERGYGKSFLNLHRYVHRQGAEADMAVLQPYEYYVNTSELIRILRNGHANVKLTDKEWDAFYNWIDYNVPDKGYFDANKITSLPYKGYDQYQRRIDLTNKYGCGMGVDWKKELVDYASYLKNKGEVKPEMPTPTKSRKYKNVKVKGWPFDATKAKELQQEAGNVRKEIVLAPGIKMAFVRIPRGSFVMGSNKGVAANRPASKVKIKNSFWMGEVEVTNAQYKVLCPEHDSRYVDQLWKDHVNDGYPANLPEQPVIRISYLEAMNYCKLLSEKTGLKMTLPTEAQWEWACRAGSDTDFWFGTVHSDFGKYENLADVTCNKMAVIGVDPQPMDEDNYWYKYYTYLPKSEDVDDGAMNQIDSKKYQPNPYGLYSMHGNIAEWTKSDYVSYPYNEKTKEISEYKVVRGGSYIERPKFSTAYTRKGYFPHQRVFNVGFRVIIEE